MSEPPKRGSSDHTLVIPRDALAPVRRVDREAPTLVPCPVGCDNGMVSVERRNELLDLLIEPPEVVVDLDEPGEAP